MSALRLSRAGTTYVISVAAVGAAIICVSAYDLYLQQLRPQWLILVALTLLSGSATVRLPSVPATISISETFVFTSVLLFGPATGAVIVFFDGLIISLRLVRRRRAWFRMAFNMAAPTISIWCAAHVFLLFPGVTPLIDRPMPIEHLVIPLIALSISHFLFNTWLIAFAVAFETNRPALDVWRRDLLWLSMNYFAGASLSALLVLYTRNIDLTFLGIIVPLLLVLYFTFKIPMARVEDTNRHLGQVNTLYLSTIETLAMAIDAKDQVTHGHIRRVQSYAIGLAKSLGICDTGLLKAIEASALLHDMGKLAIPEHILNKPGKLSKAEFEKMKMHAAIGADILSAIEFPYPVVPIVRHHHENWDGSGYPDGLKTTDIPIGARILSVVDCYDALTSDRPYRPRLPHDEATAILLQRRGTMYDPLIVDTFIRVYPSLARIDQPISPGSKVDLPARQEAIVRSEQIASAAHVTLNAGDKVLPTRVVVDSTCEQLRLLAGAAVSLLAIYDPERDDLVIGHVGGTFAPSMLGHRLTVGERSIGWVAANQTSILNSDPALDFTELTVASQRLMSGLVVPLASNQQLVGVLALYASSPFTEETQRAVERSCRELIDEMLRDRVA
jgi:putative nucleotidyltransferase with HDIG domain